MECDKARELIQERLGAALDAKAQGELGAHLEGCPECRAFESGLEKLHSLLAGEPLRAVPAGFGERVVETARRRRVRALSSERRNLWAGAACAAAAVVVLAILPFLVELPQTGDITGRLATMLPELPQSAPSVADALGGVESSWRSLSEITTMPPPGLTGTLVLLLCAFAAAAAGLEAVYLTLPYWRKR